MADGLLQYNTRVRSYEVSIWTLQDRFLSVLKWATMDCKGQIQEPQVTLRDDGTQEFTFSIPKYYYNGASRIVNPMWLHLENQPLEANMHKLKIVFNKETEDEKVIEFLVTEVVHDHSADNVDLNVKAEGLAFHELGKIGYKIALTEQNFLDALDEWEINGFLGDQPVNNIQFWNDLVFKDSSGNWKTNWTYELQMDWSATSRGSDVIRFSDETTEIVTKRSDRLYEDEYVSSWEIAEQTGKLQPRTVQGTREKFRIINVSSSNIYNITQDIAKEFGVFCRYEYLYNENYEIIGRKVIYYNNYLYDVQGHIDLTYPYNSTAITRTVDNSNVTTKMYVTGVDYDSDTVTIMDVDANKSKEDYLLNFDYLYNIQGITDEQYEEIEKYEATMHTLNTKLIEIQERIRIVENQLTEAEAQLTLHENAISLDRERIEEAGKLRAELTGGTNVIPITGSPCTILYKEERGYYINIRWNGLIRNTLKLYRATDYTGSSRSFSGLVTNYQFVTDEFQNVIRIEHINGASIEEGNTLWAVGEYNPTLAYDNIEKIWQSRLVYDLAQRDKCDEQVKLLRFYLWGCRVGFTRMDYLRLPEEEVGALGIVLGDDENPDIYETAYSSVRMDQFRVLNSEEEFQNWDTDYFGLMDIKNGTPELLYNEAHYLEEKEIQFNKFERMMGPALREGYWNPENYHDYGDLFKKVYTFSTGLTTKQEPLRVELQEHSAPMWDYHKYYDGETPLLYETNLADTVEQHLAIDLRNLPSDSLVKLIAHLDEICFVYSNPSVIATIQDLKANGYTDSSEEIIALQNSKYYSYQINSQCELGWIATVPTSDEAETNSVQLALIVTGAKDLDDTTYDFIVNNRYTTQWVNPDTERIETRIIEGNNESKSFIGYPIYDSEGNVTWEKILVTGGNASRFIGTRQVANEDYDNNGTPRAPTPQEYQYKRVYPRFYFDSLKLKHDELKIFQHAYELEENTDYYIVEDDRSEGLIVQGIGYYATLRPRMLLSSTESSINFTLLYSLSNLDVAIYLDAIKVMKENAYPKISYNVELSLLNPDFVHTAYNRLNQVVHINDIDLQLENISGYISSVMLNLDHPWEDTVEIKNYETKFEDLFTTIVAQTEAMKSNQIGLTNAIQAFTSNGLIDPDVVMDSVRSANLNLAFNQGKLTIDQEQGIWGTSDSGVVAFRGGGIFTATERDGNGAWIWNTGILPSGINANLITSGQIDTNKIKIYAGDQLKFQWNGEGLYAYKSFPNEYLQYLQQQDVSFVPHSQLIDKKQYVVYRSEGLFLTSEAGSYVMKNNNGGSGYIYEYMPNTVDRVEISWQGLILRNWNGDEVFFADPDTGNLTLSGRIETSSGHIGGWEINDHMLAGAGIQLISGAEANAANNAGIYLSDSQELCDTVTINGSTYYTYYYTDPNDGRQKTCYMPYYTPGVNSITLNGGQEAYTEQSVVKTVSPKYVFSVTSYDTDIETAGSNTWAEATATSTNNRTTLYFAKSANSRTAVTDSRGIAIEYDLTNGVNASWYVAAKLADPTNYRNYITEVYGNDYVLTVLSSNAITLTPSVVTTTTFSVRAQSGEAQILAGTIGNFTINRNSLTGGTITNSILNIDNYYMAGSTKHAFGDCFCDISSNSSQGIFTLTRVDGRTANFNIAAMEAYQNAVAAAGSITLTLVDNQDMTVTATAKSGNGTVVTRTITVDTCGNTCTGTCKGGCSTDCTGGCSNGCSGSCGGSCDNSCSTGCKDGCKTGCGRGCENGCKGNCGTGCANGCTGTCTIACQNDCEEECIYNCGTGCASTCTGQCTGCTGGCKNTCTGSCSGGCTGSCKGTCGVSCAYNTH